MENFRKIIKPLILFSALKSQPKIEILGCDIHILVLKRKKPKLTSTTQWQGYTSQTKELNNYLATQTKHAIQEQQHRHNI